MTNSRVLRYNVINLDRQRWAAGAGRYSDAVRIAEELETATRQLHGIERG